MGTWPVWVRVVVFIFAVLVIVTLTGFVSEFTIR